MSGRESVLRRVLAAAVAAGLPRSVELLEAALRELREQAAEEGKR